MAHFLKDKQNRHHAAVQPAAKKEVSPARKPLFLMDFADSADFVSFSCIYVLTGRFKDVRPVSDTFAWSSTSHAKQTRQGGGPSRAKPGDSVFFLLFLNLCSDFSGPWQVPSFARAAFSGILDGRDDVCVCFSGYSFAAGGLSFRKTSFASCHAQQRRLSGRVCLCCFFCHTGRFRFVFLHIYSGWITKKSFPRLMRIFAASLAAAKLRAAHGEAPKAGLLSFFGFQCIFLHILIGRFAIRGSLPDISFLPGQMGCAYGRGSFANGGLCLFFS